MERPPHYDYRDVLWAPAKALTAKRILTMTVFIGVAFVLFDAFVYLALAFEGENLKFVWGAYNIFPFVNFHLESLAASAVYAIGALAALLALMLGFLAVAEMDMEQIRGNRFLTFQEATQFALSRLGQMLVSEITIVAFLVFVAVVFALMGLISRIPFVGEWLYALFFAVPGFIVAILSVFTIAVLSVSVLLLPAVAAAERKGEAFGAILETFSTVIRQPWRWLGYTAYSLVAAKVCGFIYAYFCYRAVQFSVFFGKFGGGDRVEGLVRSGLSHLPANSQLVRDMFNIFPGIDFGFTIAPWLYGGSAEPVGYVMSFMILLIFMSIFGYIGSVLATAQSRAYMVIRFVKDDYRIHDESPLFFNEEPVNPVITEEDKDSAG